MRSFNRGAHLVTQRTAYTHHGIYLGDGMVIHYSGISGNNLFGEVEIVSLASFTNGENLWVQPHNNPTHDAEESINRAYSRLGENLYNVAFNNCEHFVNWCIEGLHSSKQVNDAALLPLMLALAKKSGEEEIKKQAVNILARSSLVGTTATTSKLVASSSAASVLGGYAGLASAGMGLAPVVAPVLGAVAVTALASEDVSDLIADAGFFAGEAVSGTVDVVCDVVGGAAEITGDVVGGAVGIATDVVGGTFEVASDIAGGVVDGVRDLFGWW